MLIALLIWLNFVLPIPVQSDSQPHRLLIMVKDETGVPVAGAKITLIPGLEQPMVGGETDKVGRYELIGLTATGRATIATLQLNRAQVVNLRRVLSVVGKHPPVPHSASE